MTLNTVFKKFYKFKVTLCLLVASNLFATNILSDSNKDFDNYIPKYIDLDQNKSVEFNDSFIYKDWVTDPRPYRACPGYYQARVIPKVLKPEISADSFELAKEGISILNGNVIYLDQKNKVSAKQAMVYRDANLNQVTTVKAEGNIEYLTDDIRVISNFINIDVLTNTAVIDSPSYFSFYPRNARGQAQKSTLIKDQSYTVYDASFTTCPPGNNAWQINADKIVFDPINEIGTAKNTYLYFYNIPVFYTPYLRFNTSTKRETGFLMPVYSSSSRYGYSLATPLYLNLAPNYDATLTPRYMTKRDWQFAVEARHLNKFGANTTNVEYLPNDKEFEAFRNTMLNSQPLGLTNNDPRITNLKHASKQRYAVNINDSRQWLPELTSNVDYSYLSDNQYFLDLPKTNIIRENTGGHLLQQAKIDYNYYNWQLELLAQGYQTLHTIDGPDLTEPYRILPSINLSNNNILLTNLNLDSINIPLIASINSHATRFASPSNPKESKLAEGQRYYVKPALSAPIQKSYGYITPKIASSVRYYDLNQLSPNAQRLNYDKKQTYFIPIYSIDSGLYFDKTLVVNNNSFIHSLEPRLFYLNIPKKNQNQAPDFDIKQSTISYEQLFRDNSFNGYDRQDSANLITTGLVSRVKNSTNGSEYAKLQLGQSYYFEDKSTTICNQDLVNDCIRTEKPSYQTRLSPFVSILDFDIASLFNSHDKLYGLAEWQWDYFVNSTNKVNFGFHYTDGYMYTKTQQTLINFEYNYLQQGNIQTDLTGQRLFKVNDKRNDLSTLETSLKLPLPKYLVLLGFYSYDLRNQASLDKYLGAELQNCCWAIRAGYRSQLRLRTNSLAPKKYDNIFTVQFSLKGLGEINQSFENILRNNITGYQNQLDTIY